jgi:hypothetical protein
VKKTALTLFVCGLASLVIGSVLAIPSVQSNMHSMTITCCGTIRYPDDSSSEAAEAPLPQQTKGQISLDMVGYFTILTSIGFFATGLVISRKRN